jgi:putative transposase
MRTRRVDSSLHTASRRIIDLLLSAGIGTLVIGKNPLWKQDVQLGKRTNQQFVQIPHARFIDQLTYKARLVGIQVILQEESYTSKARFLDGDPVPTYRADQTEKPVFSGSRIARSWYRTKDGTIIHADVNGSYTILRKRSSDPRPSGARRSGRRSSPQTAGALKRMPDRPIGHHFKILYSSGWAAPAPR